MRYLVAITAFAGLSACTATVPDSGAGVGFGDYGTYQQKQATRDAQLQGQALPSPAAVSSEQLSAGSNATSVAQETQATLAATSANSGVAPIDASPSNPAPELVQSTSISDENDFGAVGARRSIEGDAALIAQNKAQYQQIQPTALPTRTGSSDAGIVAFALSTSHSVGQSQYRRSTLGAGRFDRNCAKYPSPDMAQAEFLAIGGPKRDRKGLDPDGDGYACSWDPSPFRNAKNG